MLTKHQQYHYKNYLQQNCYKSEAHGAAEICFRKTDAIISHFLQDALRPVSFEPDFFQVNERQPSAQLNQTVTYVCNVCGLSFCHLTNLVCERHIKASSDFAERILADSEHLLHEELSKARSHTSTRSRF